NYGILCGKVKLDGVPVDGLPLTLVGDNATSFTTITSGTGYYAFVKIPGGRYLVRGTAEGRHFAEKVTVTNGSITTLDIVFTKEHL
ncbi:MAG: carboxypeptidase-like regulatory domain-containing protein, partial [Candidatus Sumerlaeia bacterium]|nr:carboxypeptidase-like regulatory domain-containing protein [Candidatus Sumerlaeia bacterium]